MNVHNLLPICLAAVLTLCNPCMAQDKPSGKVKAFVGILPVAYFVERVGGPHVETSVLVSAGQDPHTFDPAPRLMAKLSEAKLFFLIGFPFEEAVVKKIGSTFRGVEVVDLRQGIELRPVTEDHKHNHGAKHRHKHLHRAGEKDPHIWLDPQLAKVQARAIGDALSRIDPVHTADYERNVKSLQDDLDAVHERLKRTLEPLKGRKFYVFHPAYGYFAAAYGLEQVAVEIGGKEPSAKQLARLIEQARAEGVKVIFVQPQFSRKSGEALAEAIGGAVVPLDDLSADYLKNLEEMASKLEAALSPQKR